MSSSSKPYPGRRRGAKAYWKGVSSARLARAVNPYSNPTLRELFERGRQDGLSGARTAKPPPPPAPPKAPSRPSPSSSSRSSRSSRPPPRRRPF